MNLKVTFTPLKNGKFKCNQTGKIIKRGQLRSYRNAREKNLLQLFNAGHRR